jgi:DNA-binding FadR family transcriptional regulator
VHLPKAGEIVARQLRNRIVRGEICEGEMLPSEPELVRQFGVCRPTLREAVRILESERLLEMTRGLHGGPRVLSPNVDVAARYFGFILQSRRVSLADVYRTRVLIEPAAARILATEGRSEAVEALRACTVEARRLGKSSGLAFSRFHQVLIEQTRVETLALLMGMLNLILDRYLFAVTARWGEYVQGLEEAGRAIAAQERLIGHIERKESESAAALWRGYLREAEKKLEEWQPTETVVDLLQNE